MRRIYQVIEYAYCDEQRWTNILATTETREEAEKIKRRLIEYYGKDGYGVFDEDNGNFLYECSGFYITSETVVTADDFKHNSPHVIRAGIKIIWPELINDEIKKKLEWEFAEDEVEEFGDLEEEQIKAFAPLNDDEALWEC